VAPRPGTYLNSWKRISWDRWGKKDSDAENGDDNGTGNGEGEVEWGMEYEGSGEEGAEDGELVLEEVKRDEGWGRPTVENGNAKSGAEAWGTPSAVGAADWGTGPRVGWDNVANGGWESINTTGWGESPDQKYKPPHIKALEEKAQIEAVGW